MAGVWSGVMRAVLLGRVGEMKFVPLQLILIASNKVMSDHFIDVVKYLIVYKGHMPDNS